MSDNEKIEALEWIIEYAMIFPDCAEFAGIYDVKVKVVDYHRINGNKIEVKVILDEKEIDLIVEVK